LAEKSTERKLAITNKCEQKTEKCILFKPQDKVLARNIAAKKIMAAELSAMDLSKKSISRLLNLKGTKE